MFAWGSNQYGQLGTGRHNYEINPIQISGFNGFDSKISLVSCTGWSSFAVDTDGSVRQRVFKLFNFRRNVRNKWMLCIYLFFGRYGLGVMVTIASDMFQGGNR